MNMRQMVFPPPQGHSTLAAAEDATEAIETPGAEAGAAEYESWTAGVVEYESWAKTLADH